ncbi:hypothetical protein [Novipirellula artificiosorum]|uniref:Uncharacterized protein n=1 Tax=Novipirellula artificiosorum TaxID=2528016 RepID=A0A5C6DZG5_9BACT|nr:hypothetical protein [Novipirellula artificiosorum]TWU40851.1 hypothetical protein Poly41_16860 [Novipirellula artificiosorum]
MIHFRVKPNVPVGIPPMIGVLASLWPLDGTLLAVVCLPLILITLSVAIATRSLRQLFYAITAFAILLSTILYNMPLRTAFAFSRSSFDQLADDVESGRSVDTPCWIGPIRICKAETYGNGVICLWTDDSPGGHTGFVRHGPSNLPFNLWSHSIMNDSWQFIAED